MNRLKLTYLGRYWEWHGDLFTMRHPDGLEARVLVDSVGELWVDIRRRPEGRPFYSERVESFRAYNGPAKAEEWLVEHGFGQKRMAPYAHRVREPGA